MGKEGTGEINKVKKIEQRIFKDIKKYWPIGAGLLAMYIVIKKMCGAFCPMVNIFGLSCAGCGMTRAVLYVLKGQFQEAFYINPCVYLWIVFFLYIIVVRYVLGKPLKYWQYFVGVIAVCMFARHAYGMYRYYPNRPPFSYTGNNLMEKIIPGYREMVRNFRIR